MTTSVGEAVMDGPIDSTSSKATRPRRKEASRSGSTRRRWPRSIATTSLSSRTRPLWQGIPGSRSSGNTDSIVFWPILVHHHREPLSVAALIVSHGGSAIWPARRATPVLNIAQVMDYFRFYRGLYKRDYIIKCQRHNLV